MADFRRSVPAFALLFLLLGLATANAQAPPPPFTCTVAAAVTPPLRAEGLTELTGDIVIDCQGGQPTPVAAVGSVPQVNVTVFLNTTVTSRIFASAGASGAPSEALLLIDDPNSTANPTGFFICGGALTTSTTPANCPVAPTGVPAPFGPGTTFNSALRPNVWQGYVSGNSVTFFGVPVEPPGTQGTRRFRITNVRANAAAVAPGTGLGGPLGGGTPGQVVAIISSSAPSLLPIFSPQQIVGLVQTGLLFTVLSGASGTDALGSGGVAFPQCQDISRDPIRARLRFREGFANSFKTRYGTNSDVNGVTTAIPPAILSVPGGIGTPIGAPIIGNSESGFILPPQAGTVTTPPPAGIAGVADFGTRLKATFTNLPNGVDVYVGIINIGAGTGASPSQARLVAISSTQAPGGFGGESFGFFPIPATHISSTVTQLPVTTGSAVAVWEVHASNPLAVEDYIFQVHFRATANPAQNLPAATSPAPAAPGTVNGSFAPSSTSATATTGPIPRFVLSPGNPNIIAINLCRTNLLFPFVTNQAGFDTGLAIANTTMDPFGTAGQNGACTLNFYGSTTPITVPATTPPFGTAPPLSTTLPNAIAPTVTINAGQTWVNTAGSINAGFQGYMIAVCNFQYAHGFAFISDIGARNLAMGYLALVIPDPARGANPVRDLVNNDRTGEVLGQ